jgi:hypothetical protein
MFGKAGNKSMTWSATIGTVALALAREGDSCELWVEGDSCELWVHVGAGGSIAVTSFKFVLKF